MEPGTAPHAERKEIGRHAGPRRLPLGVAALLIGSLSAALWLGIARLFVALL
ncbi:MAG: hypothetical protein M0Z28_25590 [Rhodospirillales bacterium]|nr:hypothetical protein [Rhodospirillales bacterium]